MTRCVLNGGVSRVVFDRNRIVQNAGRAFDVLQPGVRRLCFVGNQVAGNGDNTRPASDALAGPAVVLVVEPAEAVGGEVRFSLRVEDGGAGVGGEIEAVVWDGGVGPAGQTRGGDWSCRYGRAGSYRVSAVVWWADGRASFAQAEVAVVAAP